MKENQKFFMDELQRMKNLGYVSSVDYTLMCRRYEKYLNHMNKYNKTQEIESHDVIQNSISEEKNLQSTVVQPIHVQNEIITQTKISSKPTYLDKLKKRELNLSIIFSAGIALILVSAIYMIYSTWYSMTNVSRVISLSVFDILFFGASIAAKRYLKLTKTSFAFWNLGVLIIPIIFCAIGLFSLIGDYLSFKGEGTFLYLSCSFTLLFPILLYSTYRYKSPLYLVISIVDIFWVVFNIAEHFKAELDLELFLWTALTLGLVLGLNYVNKFINSLTKTYKILTEVLFYIIFIINLCVEHSLFLMLSSLTIFIIAILLSFKLKKNRFIIAMSITSFVALLNIYDFIYYLFDEKSNYLYSIPFILASVLMMIPTLLLRKNKFLKSFNYTNVIIAYILLGITLLFKENYQNIFSTISLYTMFTITLVYLKLGKNFEIKQFFQVGIFPLLFIANINLYSVLKEYCSKVFLDYYTNSLHIYLSAIITMTFYLICKFENKTIEFIDGLLNILFVSFTLLILPTMISLNKTTSLYLHLVSYFVGFLLNGILSYRYYKNKDNCQLPSLVLFFSIIFINLFDGINKVSNILNKDNVFTSSIIIIISLILIMIGLLKTNIKKVWVYFGVTPLLFSTVTIIGLSIRGEGSIFFLISYILMIAIHSLNFKKIEHKEYGYLSFSLIYIIPFLENHFFYNHQYYIYILGFIFILFNLTTFISSLKLEDKKIVYQRKPNQFFTYMSYGLMILVILRSFSINVLNLEMAIFTSLLPLSLFLLAYHENNINNHKLFNTLAIFTIYLPLLYLNSEVSNFINLLICFALVLVGFIKSNLQKTWNHFGATITAYAAILMIGYANKNEGSVILLLVYFALVIVQTINYSKYNKLYAYFNHSLIYIIPFLNTEFFNSSKAMYYILLGIMFYSLNASTIFSSLKIEGKALLYNKKPIHLMTYMSYGFLALIILKSFFVRFDNFEMSLLTLLLPVTLFLLAFHENQNDFKITYKSIGIFSVLIPYWFILGEFDINKIYIFDFVVIPVLIVGIFIYYFPIRKLISNKYILASFMVIPLCILILEYYINSHIQNGIIIVFISTALLVSGFLLKNIVLYISGIISLVLDLLIIMNNIFEGKSPWWMYLLFAGLSLVFFAAYMEYLKSDARKNKNKEIIDKNI